LVVVALIVAGCGSSDNSTTPSLTFGVDPTGTTMATTTTTAAAVVTITTLEEALATTRRIAAGRFELLRTTTLTTEDNLTLRFEGSFDRSSMRLSAVQTYSGSKRLLDALAAQSGAGTPVDFTKSRITTLRDDNVVYVGPSLDGGEPPTWLKYDQAALDRLSPDSAVQITGDLLVMMIDSVAFVRGASVETLSRADVNGKTVDAYRTTVTGVSIIAELGNSVVRTLHLADLANRITAAVPAVAYIDSGRIVRLTLDLMPLYADVVKLSGNPSADLVLKSTKSSTSQFTLTESAAAGTIPFTLPDPAKVRAA
jgi:hypothetical protein